MPCQRSRIVDQGSEIITSQITIDRLKAMIKGTNYTMEGHRKSQDSTGEMGMILKMSTRSTHRHWNQDLPMTRL